MKKKERIESLEKGLGGILSRLQFALPPTCDTDLETLNDCIDIIKKLLKGKKPNEKHTQGTRKGSPLSDHWT